MASAAGATTSQQSVGCLQEKQADPTLIARGQVTHAISSHPTHTLILVTASSVTLNHPSTSKCIVKGGADVYSFQKQPPDGSCVDICNGTFPVARQVTSYLCLYICTCVCVCVCSYMCVRTNGEIFAILSFSLYDPASFL